MKNNAYTDHLKIEENYDNYMQQEIFAFKQ